MIPPHLLIPRNEMVVKYFDLSSMLQILRAALLLIVISAPRIWSHPADIKLPDIEPTAPQAVNNLQTNDRPKQTRSIESADKSQNHIEATIAEVQQLIKSNPQYPKLTRGEILDLLENISRTDPEVAKKLKLMPRDDGKRAIMVVMPYTPDSNNEMADFYTKPPVTHLVGSDTSTTTKTSTSKKPSFEPGKLPLTDLFPDIKKDVIYQPKTNKTADELSVQSNKPLRRRRPELTSPATTSTTAKPSTTRRSQLRRRTTTVATKVTNRHYVEEVKPVQSASNSGITIVAPPNLGEENLSEKQTVDKKPTKPKPFQRKRTTTAKPISDTFNIPNGLKATMQEMDLDQAAFTPENTKVFQPATTKITAAPTTSSTTEIPDASNIADGLTPEMRELLMNFGLIPNANDAANNPQQEYKSVPETAPVTADSYVGFKPLPDNAPSRDDMEAFLSSFGLGRSSRKQKNKPKQEKSGLNLDMIPESFESVVTDIGLKEKQPRKIESHPVKKTNEKNAPEDNQYATEEELRKLGKLLDMIKLMEQLNGTSPEAGLKQADLDSLKELVGSLNNDKLVPLDQQKGAPDPLNYDQGIIKNEVKRQEGNNTANTTSDSATAEDHKTTLTDLEDSFGGPKETATEEATLPPPSKPKHNGFYYLVDWNTFLDIDNQKGKRVNLRFQPKVGDPKRFLSVSVP